jgi:hypothetical protein
MAAGFESEKIWNGVAEPAKDSEAQRKIKKTIKIGKLQDLSIFLQYIQAV